MFVVEMSLRETLHWCTLLTYMKRIRFISLDPTQSRQDMMLHAYLQMENLNIKVFVIIPTKCFLGFAGGEMLLSLS